MSLRTTIRTLVFAKPFSLSGVGTMQPAGVYVAEIDEGMIEGLSFPVYRRTSTRLRLPPDPERPGVTETVTISPTELGAALPGDSA